MPRPFPWSFTLVLPRNVRRLRCTALRRGAFTFADQRTSITLPDARPCSVELHAWATNDRQNVADATPCAVKRHALGYKERQDCFADATSLRRGASRLWLQRNVKKVCRCHGLAPAASLLWLQITSLDGLGCTALRRGAYSCGYKGTSKEEFADATSLRRGSSLVVATKTSRAFCGCQSFRRWSFTFGLHTVRRIFADARLIRDVHAVAEAHYQKHQT